ncbi:MAG TPA: hypothetical protein VD766_05620 [Solirubrobacterales bacterium]|nr:hypothetical protein [Solirubrobacterales bacterium]
MDIRELLISLLPVFLLIAALLCGKYPGERTIARLAASVAARRARPRAPRAIATRRRIHVAELRASELLARSLATRPPPASAVL